MRIGVDLGGTKIEAAVLAADGRIVLRQRVRTPQGNYAETVEAVAKLVEACEAELGRCRDGRRRHSRGDLASHRPGQERQLDVAHRPAACGGPVRAASGGRCGWPTTPTALRCRRPWTAPVPVLDTVFGVILGTGVGGGIVVGGRVLDGRERGGGRVGPQPASRDARRHRRRTSSGRGRRAIAAVSGCIETFLSGPGLARDFQQHSGRRLSPADVVASASRRRRRGRGLSGVATRIGWRAAWRRSSTCWIPTSSCWAAACRTCTRLYENVPRLWSRYVFSDAIVTRLVPPVHGDSSGVRGAAWLWPAECRG